MIRTWPRSCEALLAVWLIASGWILEQSPGEVYRAFAVVMGVAVLALEALSLAGRARYAYLLILPTAAFQIWFAFSTLPAESQGAQNLVTVALLLAMFAVLPTDALQPPLAWRRFNDRAPHS